MANPEMKDSKRKPSNLKCVFLKKMVIEWSHNLIELIKKLFNNFVIKVQKG